jgi:hypothetical protein
MINTEKLDNGTRISRETLIEIAPEETNPE